MGGYKVVEVFDIPVDTLWATVSGFGDVDKWMPGVESCVLEGEGAGTVRTMVSDGNTFKEKLLAVDEENRKITYTIVEAPLPVTDYEATMQLTDKGDGKTEMIWQSTWEPAGVPLEQVEKIFKGFYAAGIQGFKNMHAS